MSAADDQLRPVADTIRCLAMDAVQKADSGHPGMPMGMADVATVLWTRFLRYSPKDPEWLGRDRFVLSAGHGSMLLYSLLHLAGFDLTIEDLKQFRQLHSKTPGHPEWGETPGVETTTGPLGQGFANGVGMALAAQMEAARFDNPLLQTRVFGIVSDGDLMEGIASEAASLAGHLALGNLLYFYDDNQITIEGETSLAWSEDAGERFRAYGWHVQRIDGHDFGEVQGALEKALAVEDRPHLIICRTHIAHGSPNKHDTAEAHGSPLGEEEVELTKKALGMPLEAFHVDDGVRKVFEEVVSRNERIREKWQTDLRQWEKQNEKQAAAWRAFRERRVPDDLFDHLRGAVEGADGATRALSGKVIQKAAELVSSLVGGSADLDPSTKTGIKSSKSFSREVRAARNLHFGVREHAMGGILSGMALHGGFLPMGSTFLVFSDYMRPSIRLAALMKLPVTYVFTHDSLMVGEDGPTHQPVEQAASLRLIPNLHVWRPADGLEVAAAWTAALRRRDGPTAMSLTRQKLPALSRADDFRPESVLRGGYVLRENPDAVATVVATGSEVSAVAEAADLLSGRGTAVRVVSMPCVEIFMNQEESWRRQVLPAGQPIVAVEMGRPETWCAITGTLDRVVGLDRFGASAPYEALAEHIGFTPSQLAERIDACLA